MYCNNCGEQIDDKAVICPKCGVPVNNRNLTNDAPSAGFAVLCFFIPLLGLILYLIWKDEYPLKAKSCGKGALISVIVSGVLTLFYAIIIAIVAAAAIGSGMSLFLPLL